VKYSLTIFSHRISSMKHLHFLLPLQQN